MLEDAIVLANGCYRSPYAKTAHGLIRGPSRYNIVGIIDPSCAGDDAGTLLDGHKRSIGIYESVAACLDVLARKPRWCVTGFAPPGGRIDSGLRLEIMSAVQHGISIVNGLHELLEDDAELIDLSRRHGAQLRDIRKPAAASSLHYWSGKILGCPVPRIAVLGTDCGQGKRTTSYFLRNSLQAIGIRAHVVYTGQTGWLQGGEYGFILDATPNDFVSGELEAAILRCAAEQVPEVIIIEGQSALRNPAGPCGSELIVSGAVSGVILQHSPERDHFKGLESLGCRMPDLQSEIALIKAYGADVWAISMNRDGLSPHARQAAMPDLESDLQIPVVDCLDDGGLALARLLAPRFRRAA